MRRRPTDALATLTRLVSRALAAQAAPSETLHFAVTVADLPEGGAVPTLHVWLERPGLPHGRLTHTAVGVHPSRAWSPLLAAELVQTALARVRTHPSDSPAPEDTSP